MVQRILSNISRCTGPNFAIFSPYESALRAHDGSVLYFPICQGTLPWQPNNVAEMKANRYYVHSLQFGRWSTVLFRYYLLGSDTVAPSGLLARLCHAFLVSSELSGSGCAVKRPSSSWLCVSQTRQCNAAATCFVVIGRIHNELSRFRAHSLITTTQFR